MRATAHTCGRANTSLWSNATTDVGNKLAPDFGQRALRRLAFKTSLANSLPKRRATANQPLDLLRWPAYRPCFRLVVGNNGRSQSLSVGRAALLMRAHERRRGRPYTLALALRADVALGSPFALASMDPGHVWLPAMCGSVIKRQSWQGPSSAPAPLQGDSGGSGQWGNPRGRGWPTGRPATASGARAPPQKLPISQPLTWRCGFWRSDHAAPGTSGHEESVIRRTCGPAVAATRPPVVHMSRHRIDMLWCAAPAPAPVPTPNPNPNPNPRGLRNGNFTDAAVFASFTNDLWVAAAPKYQRVESASLSQGRSRCALSLSLS